MSRFDNLVAHIVNILWNFEYKNNRIIFVKRRYFLTTIAWPDRLTGLLPAYFKFDIWTIWYGVFCSENKGAELNFLRRCDLNFN